MHERGVGHLAVTYPISQPDPEPSYQLGLELFDRNGDRPLPTAVYATSDTIAIGLLRAAYQTGVSVPGQVSVIGFDNIAIAAYTVPPLTTVSFDLRTFAATTLDLLRDRIEDPSRPPRRITVPHEVVPRASTTRP